MATRFVPGQELAVLHERIGRTVTELRFGARRLSSAGSRAPAGPRAPEELMRAAGEVLRSLRVAPRLAVGVGAALLVVAGIATVLMARSRRW